MDDPAALRIEELARDGYTLLAEVYSGNEMDRVKKQLADAFDANCDGSAMRATAGSVFAARNVLALWPPVTQLWRKSPLPELLTQILGPQFGLVRVLFFDKPPEESWALPWHNDLAIAVKNNQLPSARFTKPTRKGGVGHVQAPDSVLANMLAARIHLDDATEDNGPLKVIPGSHRAGNYGSATERTPHTVIARSGDVLLIRPLVSHCSNKSRADTDMHRRILHLEFSADRQLPDGYEWHDFLS